jgi:hypothetical protein
LKETSLSKSAHTFAALILVLSMFMFVAIVAADNASFIVQPQQEHVITLSLHETDSVSGSFSVASNDETGINFFISDLQGKTILTYNNVLQKSFTFIAESTGNYLLHFDNSLSSSYSKTVALNYNITRYIMGIPQEQFLLFVIVAFAFIGIIAYALLMPR